MRPVARLGRALVVFGSAAGLGACSTSAGGPSFVTLGIDVDPATVMLGGPEAPIGNPMELCARLPVLIGSSVEKEERVSGLAVKITATRDVADVTFPNADNRDTARSYELSELRHGVADSVSVSVNGQAFDVVIASLCTNP
ncbi:MAG TPA: hypothetical protein VMS65_17825 [Polyangiaceae bacterium]|nr:hypothetical protein [Polyangiaceae bacterium]